MTEELSALESGEDCVKAVVMAGAMLMRAGAEVYRVEDTMQRLGNSIPGVTQCIPYVVTTGVMCSLIKDGITFTRIARIKSESRNISVINQINELSRQAVKHHYDSRQILEKLEEIKESPIYSDWMKMLFGAVGAAGFAIFFKGTLADIIAVFVIGLLVRGGTILLSRISIIDFLSNALLSALAAMGSVLIAHYFPQTSQDTLIISSIMLLVPGLAIMNSIRDIMMGEYVSGTASLTQALFCAIAIAIGVGFSFYFASWLAGMVL